MGLGLASTAPAAAETRPIALQASATGCPSGEQVRAALVPLVGPSPVAGTPVRATVRDQGDRYSVTVADAARTIDDPSRDCLERARVAAVFIALNIPAAAPPPSSEPPLASPPPPPLDREPAAAPGPIPRRPALWVRAFTTLAAPLDLPEEAPGAGLALDVASSRLRFAAEWVAVSPITIEPRSPSGDPAAAELTRVSALLAVGPRWSRPRWEVWPRAAVVAEVLALEGQGLAHPRSSTRSNVGMDGALWLGLRASRRVAGFAAVGTSWFPRAYTLRVGRDEDLGETPRAWLHGELGISFLLQTPRPP